MYKIIIGLPSLILYSYIFLSCQGQNIKALYLKKFKKILVLDFPVNKNLRIFNLLNYHMLFSLKYKFLKIKKNY